MDRLVLKFGEFELDSRRHELRNSGVPVSLEPKPFEVLRYLVAHRDRVVSKEELLDEIWCGVIVGDASVSSAVREIRVALGDDAREPRFVQTFWRRGYRFIGEIDRTANGARSRRPSAPAGRSEIDRRGRASDRSVRQGRPRSMAAP